MNISIKLTVIQTYFKDILCHPIIINACITYSKGFIFHSNWGDDINYFFLKELFKKPISIYNYSWLSKKKKKDNYLIIGSTITFQTNKESIIWGAGVIDQNVSLPVSPKRVLAVRGPLTRNYLLKKGIDCPEIYGDPALLLPYYYKPEVGEKYKLGIIPHYTDNGNSEINRLIQDEDVLLINVRGYKIWTDFIDKICSCDFIISSSLHGLVVSEAYKIPNLWVVFNNNLIGGDFKFHDFYLSFKENIPDKIFIDHRTSKESLLPYKKKWRPSIINLLPLIDACPFELNLRYKIE